MRGKGYCLKEENMERLTDKIAGLCREYGVCRMEVDRQREAAEVRKCLSGLCEEGRRRLARGEAETGLLLAMMDAYEVTRDEGILQEVLDAAAGKMERLEVSADSVRLLVYCWYYVEEEDCLRKAGSMLEELRVKGAGLEDLEEELRILMAS